MNRRQFLIDFPATVAGVALVLALRKQVGAIPPPPPHPVNGPVVAIPFAIAGKQQAARPSVHHTYLPFVEANRADD